MLAVRLELAKQRAGFLLVLAGELIVVWSAVRFLVGPGAERLEMGLVAKLELQILRRLVGNTTGLKLTRPYVPASLGSGSANAVKRNG